jgi:hypothetical protein
MVVGTGRNFIGSVISNNDKCAQHLILESNWYNLVFNYKGNFDPVFKYVQSITGRILVVRKGTKYSLNTYILSQEEFWWCKRAPNTV